MNRTVFVIFQVVVALIVFMVLNNVAVYIMKKENVIPDPTKSVATSIFAGWVDTSTFTNKSFDTHNVFASNYRSLPRSANKMGGAQFSYTVWVRFNDISAKTLSDKVMFMQGDPTKYNYQVQRNVGGFSPKTVTENKYDYVVKCPLVRFGDDGSSMIVEFNTTNDISARAEINRVQRDDQTVRHNVFSLLPGSWALMTFVFEDDRRYNDHEDGVIFTFYLNDILYYTQRFQGALRLNKGDLVMLPEGPIDQGYMSDMTYYNYALDLQQINKVIGKGMTNSRYNDMDTDPTFNQPLYLNQYNKLEISNL